MRPTQERIWRLVVQAEGREHTKTQSSTGVRCGQKAALGPMAGAAAAGGGYRALVGSLEVLSLLL